MTTRNAMLFPDPETREALLKLLAEEIKAMPAMYGNFVLRRALLEEVIPRVLSTAALHPPEARGDTTADTWIDPPEPSEPWLNGSCRDCEIVGGPCPRHRAHPSSPPPASEALRELLKEMDDDVRETRAYGKVQAGQCRYEAASESETRAGIVNAYATKLRAALAPSPVTP